MKFWVIAYKYQEDIFWDFSSSGDTHDLQETCFLPTQSIAEGFIEDQLNDDYVPVEIELETLNKNGAWSYSRGEVESWDEEF
ncbi:hypothetical protein [Metabacillus bambusae]|uniref:DUF3906 domain-containing protein n=1 Tax=Metabacillus bambusae TaxID=2795218 RepID=A0ABS3N4P8_9BACI|nr:hypothetical protein [Metabacillus bambusae]MBO1513239.1 hypothetical protein [Metabacillus bambusae]